MSSNQTFKKQIPKELLFKLLDNISIKNEKYYLLNTTAYKKGLFINNIESFLVECKPYYHLSKQKSIENKLTYNSFNTILRQICNNNNITHTSQIKYDKSTYEIVHYIYFL